MYDFGSVISLINSKLVEQLKLKLFQDNSIFKTISGKSFSNGRVKMRIKIGNIEDDLQFFVVKDDEFKYQMLIGLDAIQKFKLIQDEKMKIFQKDLYEYQKKMNKDEEDLNDQYVNSVNKNQIMEEDANLIEINLIEDRLNNNDLIDELRMIKLDVKDKEKIKEIINMLISERDVFAKDKFDVKQYQKSEAQIRLLSKKIIKVRPYKTSIADQKEIKNQIRCLLENDLIEESDSDYASPVTLVDKKLEKRSRICIDLRLVNANVVPENQLLMCINDIVDRVRDCKFFTALDINSAFWHIKLEKESRKYTAFVTQKHHFQWKVLPFGLKNSPAIFQRILASILRKNNLSDFAINYLDDILIFSSSIDKHLKHVRKVIQALKKENFKLKFEKCKFFRKEITYLGHIIKHNESKPLIDNVQAISDFPTSQNKKNIRQILGKLNMYNKYIENRSIILKPLHDLLKKYAKFIWSKECEVGK